MSRFVVSIPITGYIDTEVQAASEEEALEKAWELFEEGWAKHFEEHWEAAEKVCEGNVFHGELNEQSAQKVGP